MIIFSGTIYNLQKEIAYEPLADLVGVRFVLPPNKTGLDASEGLAKAMMWKAQFNEIRGFLLNVHELTKGQGLGGFTRDS